MIKNIFIFTLISLVLMTSIYAFEGHKYSFEELGYDSIVLSQDSPCIKMTIDDWNILQNEPGVLGLFLHGLFENETRSSTLVIRDENFLPITHKAMVGHKNKFVYGSDEFQSEHLFVSLEQIRNSRGIINICANVAINNNLSIFKDSEIGAYKLPNFDCDDCFVKELVNENIELGKETTVKVLFENAGFADANINVFYDNLLFDKWFKLRKGTPSWQGILAQSEQGQLNYNFETDIEDKFIISPAVMEYTLEGYKFITYSNAIIIGAQEYLEPISCTAIPNKNFLSVGELANIEVIIKNNSKESKDIELVLASNSDTRIVKSVLNQKEGKRITFDINESNEKISDYHIYLKKGNDIKDCGKITLAFITEKNNYLPYIIFLLLILSLGIFVYYYYFI